MENRDMEDLIGEFDEEKGFYRLVYDWFYSDVAALFRDEVEEYCKVVIFGDEYAMSVQELYAYDREAAVEAWHHHISRSLEEDFHSWVEHSIREDIEDFISGFQKWLSGRNDERASNAIVVLMSGDIDLTKIIVDWLCDRLGYEDWNYPT